MATAADVLARMTLQFEVEEFYSDEGALLDERRYSEWVELFTEDTHYWMPLRRTRTTDELDKEFTGPGGMAYFDDDYEILSKRVAKLGSGYAWAEDPPSRTRHLSTNIRVIKDEGSELTVESNFLVYRTRLNSEEDTWIGLRRDQLRRVDGNFKIAGRKIFLEQTVLLSRNLSNFI
jgi:biphenyl 2,3-dioxygenase beta subunit